MSLARAALAALAAAALLTAAAYGPAVADAADAVSIQGRVANATLGGRPAPGLEVVLHREGPTLHEHDETTTDAEGRFRFDGVVYEPDLTYGVTVVYQGALYGADLDLSAGPPPAFTLAVYEATTGLDALSVSRASVLLAGVDAESQTLWALEIVEVVNDTDTTYVPGAGPMNILRFGLPPGATDLEVDTRLMGADLIQVDRGFAVTASVPPGAHEVMYAYSFPYSDVELELTRNLLYGADDLRFLASPDVAAIASDDLEGPRTVEVGGRSLQLLTASDLPRGARVTVDLLDLPRSSLGRKLAARIADAPLEMAAPVGLVALMLAVIALALWRGRRAPAEQPESRAPQP